jgi:hypothetical protein
VAASSRDGNLIFNFQLPKRDLALHSVGIGTDGVPKLYFRASKNVPTLLEEDVATVFRLVSEDKRPEFFYLSFPPMHPLHNSRFFKYYSPAWLRGTTVGELLSEADWDMKCLSLGTRTNEDKTSFESWSRSSILKGLATGTDFPLDAPSSSMIMSCEYARIQKNADKIVFREVPKMKIETATSRLYSDYITEKYPVIACLDEPRFLKMQELIKLIIGVEWFYKEKNVRVSKEWVAIHTSSNADTKLKLGVRKEPPKEMIPKLSAFKQLGDDIQCWEVDTPRPSSKQKSRYGYCDSGSSSMITFEKDGTPCPPEKYVTVSLKLHASASIYEMKAQIPVGCIPAGHMMLLPINHKIAFPLPLEAVDIHADETTKALQSSPLGEITMIVTEKNGELSDSRNHVIEVETMGKREVVIPDVKSLNELMSSEHTVPIPYMCLPFDGIGLPAASGGVSTRDIRVQKEPVRPRVAFEETQRNGIFTKNGHLLGLQAEHQGILISKKTQPAHQVCFILT